MGLSSERSENLLTDLCRNVCEDFGPTLRLALTQTGRVIKFGPKLMLQFGTKLLSQGWVQFTFLFKLPTDF